MKNLVVLLFCVALFTTSTGRPSEVGAGNMEGQDQNSGYDQVFPLNSSLSGDPCPGNSGRVGSLCVELD